MKLYNLPQRQPPGQRPKIFGLNPGGDPDGWVEFDHIDGMYSFCIAYNGAGKALGIVHLAGAMPLIAVPGGYRVPDTDPDAPPSPPQT